MFYKNYAINFSSVETLDFLFGVKHKMFYTILCTIYL